MAVPKDMQNELGIVRDVSARLEQGGLAYMLTGSMEMNYYAQPRMTRGIDLVVALTPVDTDTLIRLFSPDYYFSREAVNSSRENQVPEPLSPRTKRGAKSRCPGSVRSPGFSRWSVGYFQRVVR